MTITRKDSIKTDFGELRGGDVFKDGEVLYMVIEEVENKNGGTYNAVDIETGALTHFYADERVIPLHAELIVS